MKNAISARKKYPKHVNQNRRHKFVVNNEREANPRYEERNFSRQPQRKKIFIIGDNHLTRLKKHVSEKKFKGDQDILNVLV